MTLTPLTTLREAIRRVLQRFAAYVTQRPLRAGDPEPEASPAPELPPAAAPDYLPTPSQILTALDAAYEHEVLANLVLSCERLLHDEWTTTLHHLREDYPALFAPSSTFLEPGVRDEYEHWESRGEFLDALRDAQALVHVDPDPAAAADAGADEHRAETTLPNLLNSSPDAEDAGADEHRADYDADALNALVASRPLAKCQPPSATPGSYTWTASHTWQHAGYGLQCQDCGERWPQPQPETHP